MRMHNYACIWLLLQQQLYYELLFGRQIENFDIA